MIAPRTLFARALTGTLGLLTLAVVTLTGLFLAAQHSSFRHELRLRAEAVSSFTASQCQYPVLIGYRDEILRIAGSVLASDDALYVVVTGGAGETLVSEAKPHAPAIPAPARKGNTWSVVRDYAGRNVLEIARPVEGPVQNGLFEWASGPGARRTIGHVRIGFSMAREQELFAQILRSAVLTAAAAIVVLLFLLHRQLRRLLQPLGELMSFTRKVGAGPLTERAPVRRDDEVGELTCAFNQMLDRLGATTVSRDYVDNILRSMAESLIVIGPDMRIELVNPATAALLGYSEQELTGKPASVVLAGRRPGRGRYTGFEKVYRARDGRSIPVLFSTSPMPGEDGQPRGAVWLAQDMTERKRVEQELRAAKEAAEEASRAKSMFLATISHELRTPLNAVLGFSQLLEDEIGDYDLPELAGDVQKIQASARLLLALINQVLDFSKIEAGRLELNSEEFDLADVVREVVASSEVAAARNGNRIAAECVPAPLCADALRVQQSLLNLVSNACKFTHEGEIHVVLEPEERNGENWYRVAVRDTGIGISPEKLPKLFQAFSQGDASVTRSYGGTGLGLAISQKLCCLMGGEITVTSEPGQGSVFTMHLPAPRCSSMPEEPAGITGSDERAGQ